MYSWYGPPSPLCDVASCSERSISALKITRPGVVSTSSLFHRYSIGCWSPSCFASTANSTSSSVRKRDGLGSSFSTVRLSRSLSEYVR